MSRELSADSPPLVGGLAHLARAFLVVACTFHVSLAIRALLTLVDPGLSRAGFGEIHLHPATVGLVALEAVCFVAWTIHTTYQAARLLGAAPASTALEIATALLPGSKAHPAAALDATRKALGEALKGGESSRYFMGWWSLAVLWEALMGIRLVLWASGASFGFGAGLALLLVHVLGCAWAEYATLFLMGDFDERIGKLREQRALGDMSAHLVAPPPLRGAAAASLAPAPAPGRAMPSTAPARTSAAHERAPSGVRSAVRKEPTACIGCAAPVAGARCDNCGAAQKAGGFTILLLLREGANSRTYVAASRDGTELVTLKELSFSYTPKAAAIDQFEREGVVLAQMNHPHIPRFVAAFTEGEGAAMRFYVAREFVQGRSMLEIIGEGPLLEEEVIGTLSSLLDVIAYLHNRTPKILHRDIKPSNIMVRPDGSIALIDFGLTWEPDRATTGEHAAIHSIPPGELPAAPPVGYLPPAQTPNQVDETTDLYSIGVTVLHLLTGEPPWDHLEDGVRIEIPSFLALSPSLALFLRRLTQPEHDRRYLSTNDAIRDFQNHVAPKAKAS